MSTLVPRPENDIELVAGISQMVENWVGFLEREYPKTTRNAYVKGLQLFREWLLIQGKDMNIAVSRDVVNWREHLRKDNSVQTVNLRLSGVRAFYRWLIEQGAPIHNPAVVRGARRKNSRRHKRDELTSDEVNALLESVSDNALSNIRDKAIFSLMAYAAMRGIEVRRTDVGDVRTRDGRKVIWFQAKGASEKDDFKVLSSQAEKALRKWLRHGHGRIPKKDRPLFYALTRNKGERLTARGLRGIWERRKEQAGITGDRKTLHSLRHSAISNAARHNASSAQLKALGGWASIATADSYLHEVNRTREPPEDLIDYDNSV